MCNNRTCSCDEFFNYIPENIHGSVVQQFEKSAGTKLTDKTALKNRFSSIRRENVEVPAIFVGAGTCGLGAGAGKTLAVIKEYVAEKQMKVEIVEVGCIGLCSAEPIVDIQLPGKSRIAFGSVTDKKVKNILDKLFENNEADEKHALFQFPSSQLKPWEGVVSINDHSFFKKQTRWVLENCGFIDPVNIEEYIARSGYSALAKALSTKTSEELCNEVEESGLRGRGGGGFPTGRKWKFALNTPADQKYFICNADEGDPGAFMDRAVIEGDPHRLVEGLAIASYAIGASKAYVYIRAEYPLAIENLKKAITDAKEWGFIGYNILDSGFNLDIIIKEGAGAFVCGEETALIHSIEGKRGMPRPRPPFPAARGLFGCPTIINNVETLANVPKVILRGSDAFKSVGTENSKGTKVFALSGKINRTGLVEVAMGASIKEIIYEIGAGIPKNKAFKAVQIGGPSGGCVTKDYLDIQVDYESLKTIDAMMGSGGLVVMDEDNCMVDVAKFFMDFIQRESCGKCIPCREGTKRMLEILIRITKGRDSEKGTDALDRFKGVIQLEELAQVIRETSLCGLGQTAPSPVLSTLKYFREEYEAHIFGRECPACACSELISYKIESDSCIGCTVCAKKCPSDAIVGARKENHYIVDDKCIKCGICQTACKFGAVLKVTGANR